MVSVPDKVHEWMKHSHPANGAGLLMERGFRFFQRQKGISLVETLIAVSILGAIGVVFMTSMITAHRSVGILDEQLQAEALIRSQLEDIKDAPYQDSGVYPVTVNVPPQYSVVITVESPTCIGTADDCIPLEELMGGPITTIQEVTVSIFRPSGDGENRTILSVSAYKVKQ